MESVKCGKCGEKITLAEGSTTCWNCGTPSIFTKEEPQEFQIKGTFRKRVTSSQVRIIPVAEA